MTQFCVPNGLFCQGKSVKRCSSNGLTAAVETPCASDEFCDANKAVPSCSQQSCVPNEYSCVVDQLRRCNPEGSGTLDIDTCTSSEHCDTTTESCEPGACPPQLGQCGGDLGCNTMLGNPLNCLGCGDECESVNGTNECTEDGCHPSCTPDYDDCNENPNDGCETNLKNDEDHCGGCGHECALEFTNAIGVCSNGTCTLDRCDATHLNCGPPDTDCETAIDLENCGGCGILCAAEPGAPRHSTSTLCSVSGGSSVCVPTCEPGFGACVNPQNGCQTPLDASPNCGVCGVTCEEPTPDCVAVGAFSRCQARVTYVNNAQAYNNGTSIGVAHTLTAGDDRLVLAAIIMESTQSSGLAGAKPTAVTYGGTPMLASGSQTADVGAVTNFEDPYLYYYYLTDSGADHLSGSGERILQVTGTTNKVRSVAAQVIQFNGVEQASPLVLGTGLVMSSPGSACVLTSTVNLDIPGSALYVASASKFGGTAFAEGSIAQVGSLSYSMSVRFFAGYRGTYPNVLAPGSYSPGFQHQYCAPGLVLAVGIRPATAP